MTILTHVWVWACGQGASPPAQAQPHEPEKEKNAGDEREMEASEAEEKEKEKDSDIEVVQQLLALSSIHERKKERNLAELARLSFWAAVTTLDNGASSRLAANTLLSGLGVPTRLHFSEADPNPSGRFHEIRLWLNVNRGEFSARLYGIHLALGGAAMAPIQAHGAEEARSRAHSLLDEFLAEAATYFRPSFLAMWRAALPLLDGPRKFDILSALRSLLESEAEWYDQQN